MKAKNIIGQKFGKLIVISEHSIKEKDGTSRLYCLCKCDCGKEKEIRKNSLLQGLSTTCGCYLYGKTNPNYIHGATHKNLYRVWQNMKDRCYDTKNKAYRYYGERGITICSEWLNDYISFEKWSLKNGYVKGLTIDRIDNNQNYTPQNCRWVTMAIQNNNKRNNKNKLAEQLDEPSREECELISNEYNICSCCSYNLNNLIKEIVVGCDNDDFECGGAVVHQVFWTDKYMNYCPNCGRKIKREKSDE